MRQNAYLLAKIGADTAENERDFAEILPKTGNLPFAASLSVFPQYTESLVELPGHSQALELRRRVRVVDLNSREIGRDEMRSVLD